MPHMLAHGYQVLIQTAAGAGLFPHMVEDSLKAFIEQGSRFLKPVFVGSLQDYLTLFVWGASIDQGKNFLQSLGAYAATTGKQT